MIAIHDNSLPYRDPPTAIGQCGKYDPTRDAGGEWQWNPDKARLLVDFFPTFLTLTNGEKAGRPFTPQPWQADYLATMAGWESVETGFRRYRESCFFTPRKMGKTETGAGIALFCTGADGYARAQVYSAAKTRNQASRVFDPAAAMVRGNAELRKLFQVTPSRKQIAFTPAHATYEALSADAGSAHGYNPHAVLFDELHTQTTRELYEALKSGMGQQDQPLFLSMSTAGHDRNSICWEVWKYAQRVRDGVSTEPTFLPLIYELPEGADWRSEDVWHACNPNLGITVSLDFLRAEYRRAQESPLYENTFRNLYLNEWTEQAVRWLPMDAWDRCGEADIAGLCEREAWAALDMSSTTDVTAFVLSIPLDERRVALVPHFWIPEETARQAERTDRVPYRQWAKDGLVTLTPGRQVDQEFVRRDIGQLCERFTVREIAIDRWNAGWITTALQSDGFNVVAHGQGMASMSGPSKEFEKLILGGLLCHGNNPVLRWMAGNVAAEVDAAGNIKPTKAKSTGRIDGIVAAIMAVGRAVTATPVGGAWFVT